MYQVMQSYEAYIVSFALAAILTIILEFKFNKICDLNMSRKLLISRNKLKIMTLTITSLVIILINTNYTY
ncbi:hypothetical protein, partial [Clostridium tertium]|uniref:hypothetical protein n=1 Tax=Clostridium tertium TaxID=1559 RepID=UPI00374E57D3